MSDYTKYNNLKLTIGDNKYIVRERKNTKGKKPPLYLWDMGAMYYVSSLYPTKNPAIFLAENPKKREAFKINLDSISMEIIENKKEYWESKTNFDTVSV